KRSALTMFRSTTMPGSLGSAVISRHCSTSDAIISTTKRTSSPGRRWRGFRGRGLRAVMISTFRRRFDSPLGVDDDSEDREAQMDNGQRHIAYRTSDARLMTDVCAEQTAFLRAE